MLKLNIGCGPNMFAGWQNIDHVDMTSYVEMLRNTPDLSTWPEHQQITGEAAKRGDIACKVHDLRSGFPQYESDSVDAIYLGQVVEHLQPILELPKLLAECWRLLKPGCKVRITTPDLDVLLAAYMDGRMDSFAHEQPDFYMKVTPDAQLSYLMFGACGPQCTSEHYEGHMSCIGKRHAKALLEAIGFVGVTFEGKSEVFSDCLDAGMSHSWAAEATKP